jgi:hypothetical protein
MKSKQTTRENILTFNKTLTSLAVLLTFCASAFAEEIPITGTVESKCIVTQDTAGVYGNSTPESLSTATADGGVHPVVRYDVIQADYYMARIAHPTSFTESPALNDTVTWTGTTSVDQVSDALMSAYDTNKVEYDNVTEVDLSVQGSTWFKIESEADYGYGKAFPGGQYQAVVTAECIAI